MILFCVFQIYVKALKLIVSVEFIIWNHINVSTGTVLLIFFVLSKIPVRIIF